MRNTESHMEFFTELAERQVTTREFFNNVFLEVIERHFGLTNLVILYFDTQGSFLSWVRPDGMYLSDDTHPYKKFASNDVVRNMVFHEAVRDRLTYFDVAPRLYKSTDIIESKDYNNSAYVRFIHENFDSHYSISMAFGINGYIQLVFLKTLESGDFSEKEMQDLEEIYVYVANLYKNFKKFEHGKIVSDIQNQVIASGEKAYLIIDHFKNILSYNEHVEEYLKEILGELVEGDFMEQSQEVWLPLIFGDVTSVENPGDVRTKIIKNYIIKIHRYHRTYSNGIIDSYYWMTIVDCQEKAKKSSVDKLPLTITEQTIAELMYSGLTYNAIAQELVISYHTVKKHVQNIYTKCGVNSRYELYKKIEE